MHIYKSLYLDETTEKNTKKILRKIKYHAGLSDTYVIALASGSDYFDLIPGYVLKQKQYPLQELCILGLAGDYDSALQLVQKMISDFSDRYGTVCFKSGLEQEKEMNFTGYNRK
jgi:hypothetical protein